MRYISMKLLQQKNISNCPDNYMAQRNTERLRLKGSLYFYSHLEDTRSKFFSHNSKCLQHFQTEVISKLERVPKDSIVIRKKMSNKINGNQLFKKAHKVDQKNPKQTYLPSSSQIKPSNLSKLKHLDNLFNKMKRNREGKDSRRNSNIKSDGPLSPKALWSQQLLLQSGKKSQFQSIPAISSLTRLILYECELEQTYSGSVKAEENKKSDDVKCSEWINILSESLTASKQKIIKEFYSVQGTENPYELIKKGRCSRKLYKQNKRY